MPETASLLDVILYMLAKDLLDDDNAQISFDNTPFAQGVSRYAYKGKVTRGNYGMSKKGANIVVKLMKPSHFNQGQRISQSDVNAQKMAIKLAEKFVKEVPINKSIKFAPAELHTIHGDKFDANGKRCAVDGEEFLIEPFLEGKYQKFNSNSGCSAGLSSLPDFFSHWMYCHTEGRYLVCDIQGVQTETGYLCTDPLC